MRIVQKYQRTFSIPRREQSSLLTWVHRTKNGTSCKMLILLVSQVTKYIRSKASHLQSARDPASLSLHVFAIYSDFTKRNKHRRALLESRFVTPRGMIPQLLSISLRMLEKYKVLLDAAHSPPASLRRFDSHGSQAVGFLSVHSRKKAPKRSFFCE